MRRIFIGPFAVAALLLLASFARAHESPVDHVERQVLMTLRDGRLEIRYRVEPSDRNTLLQLKRMDTDRDGVVSETERRAFCAAQARDLAGKLTIEVDGAPLTLAPSGEVQLDARLGETYFFSAPCDVSTPGRHPARLTDAHARYAPGPYRLLQPPMARGAGPRLVLTERPQMVDLERHPGLVVVDFEIVTPAADAP